MELNRQWSLLLLLFTIKVNSLITYDVHWLGGPTTVDRDIPSSKRAVDIYCYTGTSKNLLALWQTVKFHIRIQNEEFRKYVSSDPAEVFKEYTEDSYGWSVVNPFNKKTSKTISVNVFNATCMAINTKEKHSIELQVQRVDIWRVLLMFLGIAVIFSSRSLSGNPLFFYLCGVLVGVFASFMVLVYYVSKLLPKKTLTYSILIGGWTVGVYLFQQVWDNVRSIVQQYQACAFWYTLVVGGASFLVCYRFGPPRNQRSKDLVMWTLQSMGVLMVFFSSEYQEASGAVALACLLALYFPRTLVRRIQGYWRRRFPPKPQLLSSEEYFEQGARETRHALESLRRHCASPDCAQWAIMLKLNDSKRFASFVEGNSHLSDDELLDYESYAFSLDRSRARSKPSAPYPPYPPYPRHAGDISDDDGTGSDDD